jgi:IS30 family transposase
MSPSDAIELLIAAGLTETVIGQKVGAQQSTINRIRRGQMTPNYDVGKALVDLATRKRRRAPKAEAA